MLEAFLKGHQRNVLVAIAPAATSGPVKNMQIILPVVKSATTAIPTRIGHPPEWITRLSRDPV